MSDGTTFVTPAQLTQLEPALFPSEIRLYNMIREGLIGPPVITKLGRRIFVNLPKLREFLENGGAELAGGWRRLPQD